MIVLVMHSFIVSKWDYFSILVLIAGAAWIWISKAPTGSTTNGQIPQPRQGFQAPDFTLNTNEGESLTLSDFHGRPVLVNLWASWCPPCRAEMPAMQRLYTDYHDKGLEILAVNATSQDRLSDALAFSDELGLTFPILLDTNGEIARLYQVQSLPTSFFIGEDGKIKDVVIGGPMSEALLRIRVDQLLEE